MRLVIASNNEYKVREIREILGAHFPSICSQHEAGLFLDVEEDGDTFSENAIKKAEAVLESSSDIEAALADDSGLSVDALGGAPGVYSARFAGEGHDDAANNKRLLQDMNGITNRTCRFISAVALARRGRPTICVIGACEGTLLEEARGEGGFGYDPLFYYPPLQKTFAELGAQEKNSVSHRRQALNRLQEELAKELR